MGTASRHVLRGLATVPLVVAATFATQPSTPALAAEARTHCNGVVYLSTANAGPGLMSVSMGGYSCGSSFVDGTGAQTLCVPIGPGACAGSGVTRVSSWASYGAAITWFGSVPARYTRSCPVHYAYPDSFECWVFN